MPALTYDARKKAAAHAVEVLDEVIRHGIGVYGWIIEKDRKNEDGLNRYTTIATKDGGLFELSAGTYPGEGKIRAAIATRRGPHGLYVCLTDVDLRDIDSTPTALVSADRPINAILSDLKRRVFDHPDSVAVQKRLVERLESVVKRHQSLREHVKVLEGYGYEFPHLEARQYMGADGYRRSAHNPHWPHKVRVNSDGDVSAEILGVNLETFGKVLEALRDPNKRITA